MFWQFLSHQSKVFFPEIEKKSHTFWLVNKVMSFKSSPTATLWFCQLWKDYKAMQTIKGYLHNYEEYICSCFLKIFWMKVTFLTPMTLLVKNGTSHNLKWHFSTLSRIKCQKKTFRNVTIEGAIDEDWGFQTISAVDIKLKKCTSKSILPKSSYLYIFNSL